MFAAVNLGTELRRFRRSRLGKLAIIAICLIPLLYSTLYPASYTHLTLPTIHSV